MNTAARLADAAAVGAVYAGGRTAAATRHVASWRQLRPLRLKGKREPVEAYELLGLLDAPGTRSGLGDEAPFVGRETELGRVAGRLAEVDRPGDPRVLVMTAEAGIGKSRFAAEVERFAAGYDVGAGRYAAHTGARVLSVRCAAFGERRRLAPAGRPGPRAAVGLPERRVRRGRPARWSRSGCAGSASGWPAPARSRRRSPSSSCWPCSATASAPATRSAPTAASGRGSAARRPRTPRRSRTRSPTCSPRSPPRRRWW